MKRGARALVGAAIVAILLIVASGCRRAPAAAEPELVATVGGDAVRWEDFEGYLERHLGESGASLGSDVLSELFDQFLAERLLVRLAVEQGVVAAGAGQPVDARRAVERLLRRSSADDEAPGADEVAAYYASRRDEFARPERVRLRQILLDDPAVAERALAEIRGGTDFSAVAARLEADPSVTADAGDQGELSRDDVPPAFADAIFALEPGEVSEVVAADYGFHLFQVVARLPAEVVPLDEARDEIERRLRQQAADRHLEELIDEARRRYDVAVHDRNLPFNYRGRYLEG